MPAAALEGHVIVDYGLQLGHAQMIPNKPRLISKELKVKIHVHFVKHWQVGGPTSQDCCIQQKMEN